MTHDGDYDIPLREFVYTLQAEVIEESAGLHPSAQANINLYMSALRDAACDNDSHEVSRLISLIRSKIAFEKSFCSG